MKSIHCCQNQEPTLSAFTAKHQAWKKEQPLFFLFFFSFSHFWEACKRRSSCSFTADALNGQEAFVTYIHILLGEITHWSMSNVNRGCARCSSAPLHCNCHQSTVPFFPSVAYTGNLGHFAGLLASDSFGWCNNVSHCVTVCVCVQFTWLYFQC